MKNTTLYVLGAVAFLVVGLVMAYKPAGGLGATLALVDGAVEVDFGDGKWMAAREGDDVKAGTNLRTAEGKTVVAFDDGSAMRLDAFTEIHVETIARKAITVENRSGRVYSRVEKTSNLVWTVKSLGTETVALGTAFSVQGNNNNKHVDVDVFESKVKVKVRKDDGLFEKEISAGKGLIVDQSQPLSKATAEKTITVEKAKGDSFVKWNIEEDAKTDEPLGDFASVASADELAKEAEAVEEALKTDPIAEPVAKTVAVTEPAPKPAPAPAPTPYIKLAGVAGDAGVKLTWSIGGGLKAPNGFKVVKSKELKPVYPGNDYNYLSNPDARSFVWKLTDGETYHFRVCAYDGNGACKTYSNDVSVKTVLAVKEPTKSTSGFEPIGTELQLNAMPIDGAVKLSWSPSASSSFQGYKVVRSETDSNLSYPNNGYLQYITSRDSTFYKDTNVTAGKSYYYRICSLQSDGPVTCGNVVQLTY